jgi:dienelactone hydrolase
MLYIIKCTLFALLVIGLTSGCAAPAPTITLAPKPTLTSAPVPSATLPPPTPDEPTQIPDNLTYEEAVHLFDDSPDMPEMKELSVEEGEGYSVHDILYTAHDPKIGIVKGWINAYLVRPDGDGPFAGILFLHDYGPTNSNRKAFLEEAKLLAQQGVVSLLIDGYFPWNTRASHAESDRQNVIGQVIELRRALDFLLAQPGVDPQRIAYVGHGFGSSYGAVLSGVEKRVKAYVFMNGWGKFSDVLLTDYFLGSSVDPMEYRKKMSVVEPVMYISHAVPAKLLFQFARNTQYITEAQLTEFSDTSSEPKEVKWYVATDALDEIAQQERLAWLTEQLSLPPAP